MTRSLAAGALLVLLAGLAAGCDLPGAGGAAGADAFADAAPSPGPAPSLEPVDEPADPPAGGEPPAEPAEPPARCATDGGLVVHEWGTFTSVQGSDGVPFHLLPRPRHVRPAGPRPVGAGRPAPHRQRVARRGRRRVPAPRDG